MKRKIKKKLIINAIIYPSLINFVCDIFFGIRGKLTGLGVLESIAD
jgi:hypothetical protein